MRRRPTGGSERHDDTVAPAVTVWEASGSPWAGVGYGDAICWHLERCGFAARLVPVVERMPTSDELASTLHVLSGGETSANSSALWMAEMRGHLEGLVGRALLGEAAVVGIGLGAQLLAATVAGGAVRDVDGGIEAGLVPVRDPAGGRLLVAQLHQQEIDPAAIRAIDGEVLFTGATTEVQGYAIGDALTGYQFHPELDPDALDRTLRTHANLISLSGGDLQDALATVAAGRDAWPSDTFERLVAERLRAFTTRPGTTVVVDQPRWADRRDRAAASQPA